MAAVGATLLLISSWLFAPVQANPLFQAAFLTCDVGDRPTSVANGDLNGDGRPDLVVANARSNTVSVLLGNGDSFGRKTDWETGLNPNCVVIDDLNGDERLDLAVANALSSTVSVLLGIGDGTFGSKTDFAAGQGPMSVAVDDLNGDGRLDLAVANSGPISNVPSPGTVSVLLGNGDGTFDPKSDFDTGDGSASVAIGDLNGDGRPDLAVANNDYPYDNRSTVSVLLGNGDGTFGPKTDFETGAGSTSVAIGDLDDDGRADLAVANLGILAPIQWGYYFAGTASVLLGNGDGTFRARIDYETGNGSASVAIGDLNGDRWPDLAIANSDDHDYANTVSVLLGNGDGRFGTKVDWAAGLNPFCVVIDDLNNDGRSDMAVANSAFGTSGTVSVLLGNGDGTLGPRIDCGTSAGPNSVAIGDLNRDGWLDLAVSCNQGVVSVLLGNGDGTFLPKSDFGAGASPRSLVISDLNSDGWPDLAVANYSSNTVSVLLGSGNGTFAPNASFATGEAPMSVAAGDLNGDERPDLVVANCGIGGSGRTVSVLLGRGDGTFGAKTDFVTGREPISVAIGDLNGDGRSDLAVANSGYFSSAWSVSVLLGNGDGTFGPKTDLVTDSGPHFVAIGDLNGDGQPDLVVGGAKVSLLLGIGNGGFGPRTDFDVGAAPTSIAIGDLNDDGHSDLVVSHSHFNTVSVLLGNGDGTFGTRTDFGVRSKPEGVAVGDLNGDGLPEIAVANRGSGSVSVLRNLGTRTPAFLTSFALVRRDNGVQARWTPSSDARVTDFRLTASRGTQEHWEIPIENEANGTFVAWDRAPQLASGGSVRYTLLYRESGRRWVVLAEQWISLEVTPRTTRLLAPYPNPANRRVVVPFILARKQHVRVTVLDGAGRELAHIDGGHLGPGAGQVVWSGSDSRGLAVASGVYVIRFVTDEGAQTRKLVVAK